MNEIRRRMLMVSGETLRRANMLNDRTAMLRSPIADETAVAVAAWMADAELSERRSVMRLAELTAESYYESEESV